MKNLRRLFALTIMFVFGVFLIPNGVFIAFADDEECDEGGPGHTSCEVSNSFLGSPSSCKIICTADYYACCKELSGGGVSCKCVEGS
jgi:hypothetical protein